MAERKLTGKDNLFFIDFAGGTDYSTIICLTNQSYSRTTDEIDAATKCGPDTQPGKQKQTISIDGQVMLSPAAGKASMSAMHDAWDAVTQFTWKYGPATGTDGDIIYSGTGFFSKLDESADIDNPATFSATIGILGDVTKLEVETPAAPTSGVVDDTANTFAFTENPSFTLAQHEKSLDSGATWTSTTNPITSLTGTRAIGSVQVRVKAIGFNPASPVLSNATAYS